MEVAPTQAKPSKSAKKQLKKKIAALERKITTYKANSKANAPRLNFYGTQANRIRQIAALNRQLAALKRKLGRL